MLAEQRVAINGVFAAVSQAESDGQLEVALQLLGAVAEPLERAGEARQYVWEWKARLQSALGHHADAEQSLLKGRTLAVCADHRFGVFRMDLLRAGNAIRACHTSAAERLLSGLRGQGCAMGEPSPARCPELLRWLEGLSFEDPPPRGLSTLRVEIALITGELWAARGKYCSALRLIAGVHSDLSAASTDIDVDQVLLLEAEWSLAAGLLRDARTRLARIVVAGTDQGRARIALVAGRLALIRGDLAEALRLSESLHASHEDPDLFTSSTALQIAVLTEFNLLQRAQELATMAIARLGSVDPWRSCVDLLQRARDGAAARGRSAMALWELPFGSEAVARTSPPSLDGLAIAATSSPAMPAQRVSFTVAWTTAANQVLRQLESGNLEAAARHQATLEHLTTEVESMSIDAQVRFSAALVRYYTTGPSPAIALELIELTNLFERIGARLFAAQTARFASWACSRLGRSDQHLELAHRAAAILESIVVQLGTTERLQFLMNKWNGRDELAAGLMRALLESRRPGVSSLSRRKVCRVYRQVDVLSHWPIDDALGQSGARELGRAAIDEVARWVQQRISARAGHGERHWLRSFFGLWALPRKTLVMHYYSLADRTYLFRIATGHIDLQVLPIGRLQLGDTVHQFLEHPDALRELSVRLGVCAAVEKFSGIRRLIVVPHDAIANVPFAALPIDGTPLCARVAISQLDRLSRLRRSHRRRRRPGRLVSIGLRAYLGSRHRELPSAEVEAIAVAQLARGSFHLLLGEQASIANLMNALPGATGLHVAAHGEFDPQRPQESGIVLRDGVEIRTLSLGDLQSAKLRNLELVTLATCRSASHAMLPGHERICLPTALLNAGARGVIASLWPIDDQGSVEIMTELYRRLRTEVPSVALARTQAAMSCRPLAHWAPLVFYGNE